MRLLANFQVVGLIGPRQSGKSTLVKHLSIEALVYLDLENSKDRVKITDPLQYFNFHQGKIICLDEIQFVPNIFVDIKSQVDRSEDKGLFLVLGSASPELLNQSSESLAGRIAYIDILGFQWDEINTHASLYKYWLRGTFPDSLLASDDDLSYIWRENYIRTFFNRDLLSLKGALSVNQVSRLFTMLAHLNGAELNIQKLSRSLGLNSESIRKYIDILIAAFQLILLPPYGKNVGKRLIKSPKLYIADTGILHCLLNIETMDDLFGHPVFGTSFESLVISNIISKFSKWKFSFYKTSNGAEIDLIMEKSNKTIAIEIKSSSSPKVTRGFWTSIEDVKADAAYIIAPVDESYPLSDSTRVINLKTFLGLNI